MRETEIDTTRQMRGRLLLISNVSMIMLWALAALSEELVCDCIEDDLLLVCGIVVFTGKNTVASTWSIIQECDGMSVDRFYVSKASEQTPLKF